VRHASATVNRCGELTRFDLHRGTTLARRLACRYGISKNATSLNRWTLRGDRMKCRVMVCALVVFASVVFGNSGRAQNDATIENYTIAEGDSTDIATAIDASVASMNFMIRSMARSRLRENNVAYQRIRIARTPAAIEIAFDDLNPIRMPTDGTPAQSISEHGETSTISIKQQGPQLIQTLKADNGVRVNTFRWEPDGKALHLDVQTSSERLPRPVSYTLVYRRVE